MADHHVQQLRKLMPLTGATISYLDVRKIAKRLDLAEDCLAATAATASTGFGNNTSTGVICATTRRLIFASGMIPPFTLQEYPYARVNAIDLSQVSALGVGKGVIRVNAGGAYADFQVNDIAGAQRVVDAVRNQLYAPSASEPGANAPSTPMAPPAEDPLTMLEALSALREERLITDEEFEAKKHELLARM